jgi:hypothetical protein
MQGTIDFLCISLAYLSLVTNIMDDATTKSRDVPMDVPYLDSLITSLGYNNKVGIYFVYRSRLCTSGCGRYMQRSMLHA